MSADNEGPLSRWSRRKAETREKRSAVKDDKPAAPSLEEESAALPAPVEPEGGEETPPPDLPDIDSLTAESDFTVFMRDGVPDQLRKLALRKLWRSDPVLANVDGLVEYGEDFTDAASVVENMKTAYQVGKGYKEEEPDIEDDADAVEDPEEDVAEAAEADETGQETGEDGDEAGEDGEREETDPSGKIG